MLVAVGGTKTKSRLWLASDAHADRSIKVPRIGRCLGGNVDESAASFN